MLILVALLAIVVWLLKDALTEDALKGRLEDDVEAAIIVARVSGDMSMVLVHASVSESQTKELVTFVHFVVVMVPFPPKTGLDGKGGWGGGEGEGRGRRGDDSSGEWEENQSGE